MKLFQAFFKITMKRNIKNYLMGSISIILSVITMTIFLILIENIKHELTNTFKPNFYTSFKFSNIQTIFCIIVILFIVNQYYKIMRTDIISYSILKALGASRKQIRLLIFLQAFLLFVLTVPFGLFSGIYSSSIILKFLSNIAIHDLNYKLLDTSFTIIFISGIISFAILIFGIMLEIRIKRKLPSQIIPE